ncbi:MAG: hypothetical protein WCW53_15145 [Syntrophales bacterium]
MDARTIVVIVLMGISVILFLRRLPVFLDTSGLRCADLSVKQDKWVGLEISTTPRNAGGKLGCGDAQDGKS